MSALRWRVTDRIVRGKPAVGAGGALMAPYGLLRNRRVPRAALSRSRERRAKLSEAGRRPLRKLRGPHPYANVFDRRKPVVQPAKARR